MASVGGVVSLRMNQPKVTNIAFTDCSEIILTYVKRNKVVHFYSILTRLIVPEAY